MRKSLLLATLIGVLACAPTFAEAAGKSTPQGASASNKSSKDAKPELPANPKFVEYRNGDTWTMRIAGLGKLGDDDGYIRYDKYDFENANIVSNVSVKGIVGVKGVGEALKKRLLDLYKESTFESDLTMSNRDKLLSAWKKSYPGTPSSDELRREVPALSTRFGNDFDFELKAFPTRSGGSIHLWVRPKGSGKVSVANPDTITQMVLDDPQYQPASVKKENAKKKKDEEKNKKSASQKKKK